MNEAIAKKANRGAFISYIYKNLLQKKVSFDFMLLIGSTQNDEEMFRYIYQKEKDITNLNGNEITIHSIKVGNEETYAGYYTKNDNEIMELMEELKDNKKEFYKNGIIIDSIFGLASFTTKEMSFKSE